MNTVIQVEIKNHFGNERIYPVNPGRQDAGKADWE